MQSGRCSSKNYKYAIINTGRGICCYDGDLIVLKNDKATYGAVSLGTCVGRKNIGLVPTRERRTNAENKKTEIITPRVTPRTSESIQERAKAAGLTVTDYLCYSRLGKDIVQVEGLERVLS